MDRTIFPEKGEGDLRSTSSVLATTTHGPGKRLQTEFPIVGVVDTVRRSESYFLSIPLNRTRRVQLSSFYVVSGGVGRVEETYNGV